MDGATMAVIGRAALACRIKHAYDLPMIGKLTRERKRMNAHGGYTYVLTLKFKKSKRRYGDEVIIAADKQQALKLAQRLFPNAKVK